MSDRAKERRPAAFPADDPALEREEESLAAEAEVPPPARMPLHADIGRGLRWGLLLVSSLIGLWALSFGLWAWNTVAALFARQDWLGWTALGLAGLAALATLMLMGGEVAGLFRLRRLTAIRRHADAAIAGNDAHLAERTARALSHLYSGRSELAWARAEHDGHSGDIMSATERLGFADRTLVARVDDLARVAIAASARRTAVVTSMSPTVVIDVLYVLFENLRMLRRVAGLYGGRPGFIGLFRLAGLVAGHMIATGGAALTDDLVHQFVGQSVAARLSGRLGQGLFNGALTARVGLAAMRVTRPLPFLEASPPRFRDMAAEVARGLRGPPKGGDTA